MSDLTYDPVSQKCSATSAYGTPRNPMLVHCAGASSLSGLFLENSWTYWVIWSVVSQRQNTSAKKLQQFYDEI